MAKQLRSVLQIPSFNNTVRVGMSAAAWMGVAGLAVLCTHAPASASAQVYDGSILVLVDLHADPMFGPIDIQQETYTQWIDASNWLLDLTEAHGAHVSFLSTGQFLEWVVEDPVDGWPLMQRLYSSGGQLGTHSHNKIRIGYKDWQALDPNPTWEEVEQLWVDHVGMMDQVVEAALGVVDPVEIRAINCARGSHVPSDDVDRLMLMETYGFTMHQQGPDEGLYRYFEHYPMNPYRPSGLHMLSHDPDGPVIISPFGPVLGKNSDHFGIVQDMRVPAVQSRFLVEVLNWMHDRNVAETQRVWCSGWATHASDIMPGSETRFAFPPMLNWLTQNFIGQSVGGHMVARYASIVESRDAYLAWEATHPGEVSFSYDPEVTDWAAYSYLIPPTAYLITSGYMRSMPAHGPVRWHEVRADPDTPDSYLAWVAYTTDGVATEVDLSAELGVRDIAVVDPYSGGGRVVAADRVPVGSIGCILVLPDRVKPMPALRLEVSPIVRNQEARFAAVCGTPGRQSHFVYSFAGAGSTYVPSLDIYLDLSKPIVHFGSAVTADDGVAEVTRTVPGIAPLRDIWFQAVQSQADGMATIKSEVVLRRITGG